MADLTLISLNFILGLKIKICLVFFGFQRYFDLYIYTIAEESMKLKLNKMILIIVTKILSEKGCKNYTLPYDFHSLAPLPLLQFAKLRFVWPLNVGTYFINLRIPTLIRH